MFPELSVCRDHFEFKCVPQDAIEAVSIDEPEFRALLNEHTLSPAHVHANSHFKWCPAFVRVGTPDESMSPWVDDQILCDCPAIHILDLLTDEISNLKSDAKQGLAITRSHLLATMPRNLTVDFIDEEGGKDHQTGILRWDINESESQNFIINLYDERGPKCIQRFHLRTLSSSSSSPENQYAIPPTSASCSSKKTTADVEGTYNSESSDNMFLIANVWRKWVDPTSDKTFPTPSPEQTTLNCSKNSQVSDANDGEGCITPTAQGSDSPPSNDQLATASQVISTSHRMLRSSGREIKLDSLCHGNSYTAQVRSDVPAALFSFPLLFTVPPLAPDITGESWPKSNCIRLEWSKSPGATNYRIELFISQELKKVVTTAQTCWSGVLDGYIPTHIKIYGVATDDTISKDPREWKVHGPKLECPSKKSKPTKAFPSYPRSPPASGNGPGPDTSSRSSNNIEPMDVDANSDTESSDTPDDFDYDYDDSDPEDEDYEAALGPARRQSRPKAAPEAPLLQSIEVCGTEIQVDDFIAAKIRCTKRKQGKSEDVVLHIHAINAAFKGAKATVLASRYIESQDYFMGGPEVHDNSDLILTYSTVGLMGLAADADTFKLDDFEAISGCAEVLHTNSNDASLRYPGTRMCCWAIAVENREVTLVHPATYLVPGDWEDLTPSRPHVHDFSMGELFAGAGGTSCRFAAAGFNAVFGVELNPYATTSWQINNRDIPLHREKVETFLHDVPETFRLPSSVAVLLMSLPCQGFSTANPGGKMDHENNKQVKMVGLALEKFKPAYLFYENVPGQMKPKHLPSLRRMEKDILAQGYSLQYRILNASHFGVASSRHRLIAIATAPGLKLPSWPVPTHGDGYGLMPLATLRDAIEDLQWRNPRLMSGGQKSQKSDYSCPTEGPLPMPTAIYMKNHNTGFPHRDMTTWDPNRTIPQYDQPLSTILAQPNDRWNCRHPEFKDQLLSVRELARVMSFPDTWLFTGPINRQYSQVGNAVPPLLAQAVAVRIREALEKEYPELLDIEEDLLPHGMHGGKRGLDEMDHELSENSPSKRQRV